MALTLTTVSFDTEFEEKDYHVDARVYYHVDNYYDADADNKRGYTRLFIDDVVVKNVTHNEKFLKVKDLSQKFIEHINFQVENYI